eukprot:4381735-Ditylum_brightwellii.AAC.1
MDKDTEITQLCKTMKYLTLQLRIASGTNNHFCNRKQHIMIRTNKDIVNKDVEDMIDTSTIAPGEADKDVNLDAP